MPGRTGTLFTCFPFPRLPPYTAAIRKPGSPGNNVCRGGRELRGTRGVKTGFRETSRRDRHQNGCSFRSVRRSAVVTAVNFRYANSCSHSHEFLPRPLRFLRARVAITFCLCPLCRSSPVANVRDSVLGNKSRCTARGGCCGNGPEWTRCDARRGCGARSRETRVSGAIGALAIFSSMGKGPSEKRIITPTPEFPC